MAGMKSFIALSVFTLAALFSARPVLAAQKFGMHVLRPEEFEQTNTLFSDLRTESDVPLYITIPFTLDDVNELERWEKAFAYASKHNIVPIVRLGTRFDAEKNAWKIPDRKDVLDLARALDQLEWPQDHKRYIILFNEPNHAAEWGGTLDPVSFAEITDFALDWFNTEGSDYRVLPAAMDLAAPNGSSTLEAFGYWNKALAARPEILNKIYAWNSHSYPNPGFAATPQRNAKNGMNGYEHELAFLDRHTDRKLEVFITETGWKNEKFTRRTLENYYNYTVNNIWSDEKVKAVTPFLLAGSPGPFGGFSFIDEKGVPTVQWQAFASVLADEQRRLVTEKR